MLFCAFGCLTRDVDLTPPVSRPGRMPLETASGTAFQATCTTSDLKITLQGRKVAGEDSGGGGLPICAPHQWGSAGGSNLQFWGVKPHVRPMGWPRTAAARQGWDRRTGFGGGKVPAPAAPQSTTGPELPPPPRGAQCHRQVPGAQLPANALPDIALICNSVFFINALLSFGVNRTPSPLRQTVAVCGVAEPIPADCAQGCAINLWLKACLLLLLLLLPPLTERGGANSHERKQIPSAFVGIQTVHYEIKAGNEAMGRGESLLSLIT